MCVSIFKYVCEYYNIYINISVIKSKESSAKEIFGNGLLEFCGLYFLFNYNLTTLRDKKFTLVINSLLLSMHLIHGSPSSLMECLSRNTLLKFNIEYTTLYHQHIFNKKLV